MGGKSSRKRKGGGKWKGVEKANEVVTQTSSSNEWEQRELVLPSDPGPPDTVMTRRAAELHEYYMVYCSAGFSREEAFTLVLTHLERMLIDRD